MLQMELKREFPKEIAEIENFYNEMEELRPLLKMEKAKEGAGIGLSHSTSVSDQKVVAVQMHSRREEWMRDWLHFRRSSESSSGCNWSPGEIFFQIDFLSSLATYLLFQ